MEQRAVVYPVRSVDIRITSDDHRYDFSADVAKALRHMADAIESDHEHLFKDGPHKDKSYESSGFDEPAGDKTFVIEGSTWTTMHTGDTIKAPDRVLRIEWRDAAVIAPPDDPPHADYPPSDEVFASLTPEEQAALQEPAA